MKHGLQFTSAVVMLWFLQFHFFPLVLCLILLLYSTIIVYSYGFSAVVIYLACNFRVVRLEVTMSSVLCSLWCYLLPVVLNFLRAIEISLTIWWILCTLTLFLNSGAAVYLLYWKQWPNVNLSISSFIDIEHNWVGSHWGGEWGALCFLVRYIRGMSWFLGK